MRPEANLTVQKNRQRKGHGDDLTMGPVFAIDNLVINLMSEGGTKYRKNLFGFRVGCARACP